MPDVPFQSQRRRRRLSTYHRSLLFGWTVSLGLLLLAVHLPLSSPAPQVGWGAAGRAAEHIPLTALTSGRDDESVEVQTEEGPPPPTRQGSLPQPTPPLLDAPPEDAPSADDEAIAQTQKVWAVAALPTRDQRPRILGGPGALHLHIHYPAAARRQGIEGRLVVTFTVHPDGWARHIRVDKPLHPLCDSAAVAAIRAVRFRPGTYEGAPVPVRMSLPVRFQLQASTPPAERRRRTASTHP